MSNLSCCQGMKWIHAFLKDTRLKVNVIESARIWTQHTNSTFHTGNLQCYTSHILKKKTWNQNLLSGQEVFGCIYTYMIHLPQIFVYSNFNFLQGKNFKANFNFNFFWSKDFVVNFLCSKVWGKFKFSRQKLWGKFEFEFSLKQRLVNLNFLWGKF